MQYSITKRTQDVTCIFFTVKNVDRKVEDR